MMQYLSVALIMIFCNPMGWVGLLIFFVGLEHLLHR